MGCLHHKNNQKNIMNLGWVGVCKDTIFLFLSDGRDDRQDVMEHILLSGNAFIRLTYDHDFKIFTCHHWLTVKQMTEIKYLLVTVKVKVGILRPVQQTGSYWDRSPALSLLGLEPTEVTSYD